MPTTGYPAELNHNPADPDDHDDSVTVEFKGVRVTITQRSRGMNEIKGTPEGTMLCLIDTDGEESVNLSVQINDSDTWEGRA